MNQNLFNLAWRETVRSAYWGKSLATTIGLGFLALYFSANFLFLGIFIPDILTKEFPNDDPISKFNSFVLAYLGIDLIVRQLMQKLPTVSFKPLLLLNIHRKTIANYLMVRSLLSFFNLLPFFLFVPAFIKLVIPATSAFSAIAWFLSLAILIFSNHFLGIYLKWRFNEAEYGFFILLAALAGLFAVNHYGIVDLSGGMGKLLDLVLANPALFILLIALPVAFYFLNIRFLLSRMFINTLGPKKKEEKIRDYSWLDRMGENGRFIALELKLIWRNKRPRSLAMMTVLMLFYGLFLLRPANGGEIPEFAFIFSGIIMTGMFSISYGQFFPAWHSNYFSMLMCQRLTMKQFLRSFYLLVTVVSMVCYLLTLPYIGINPKIAFTNLVMLFYNLGVNIPMMFFIGLYSKKRLDLNQSSVMNYQGVGVSQWLAAFPMMLLPLGLFYGINTFAGAIPAYLALGAIGLIGLLLASSIINFFAKQYRKQKHQLIRNYKNS